MLLLSYDDATFIVKVLRSEIEKLNRRSYCGEGPRSLMGVPIRRDEGVREGRGVISITS